MCVCVCLSFINGTHQTRSERHPTLILMTAHAQATEIDLCVSVCDSEVCVCAVTQKPELIGELWVEPIRDRQMNYLVVSFGGRDVLSSYGRETSVQAKTEHV